MPPEQLSAVMPQSLHVDPLFPHVASDGVSQLGPVPEPDDVVQQPGHDEELH
jgi:hypothetical protein